MPKTLTITSTGIGVPGKANLVLKNVGKGLLTGTSTPADAESAIFRAGGGSRWRNGILPGKTNTIQITFTPTPTGDATGSIQIMATPPSTGSVTVTLKGIVKK